MLHTTKFTTAIAECDRILLGLKLCSFMIIKMAPSTRMMMLWLTVLIHASSASPMMETFTGKPIHYALRKQVQVSMGAGSHW